MIGVLAIINTKPAESVTTPGTCLPIEKGGTGCDSAAIRNSIGLGNTPGALPIANGGTGASNQADALTNLNAYGPDNIMRSIDGFTISDGVNSLPMTARYIGGDGLNIYLLYIQTYGTSLQNSFQANTAVGSMWQSNIINISTPSTLSGVFGMWGTPRNGDAGYISGPVFVGQTATCRYISAVQSENPYALSFILVAQ